MNRARFMSRLVLWAFLAVSLLSFTPVHAQKKNAAKKRAAPAPEVAAPKVNFVELPGLDFDAAEEPAANARPVVLDRDETPQGQERIREIETRARALFREIDKTMDKRRPFAIDRDVKVGQFNQAEANIIAKQQARANLQYDAMETKQALATAIGTNRPALQNQLNAINNNIGLLNQQIKGGIQYQKKLIPEIDALNTQVLPFDERLVKLWAELNEARRQWLEQRQPLEKYTRGEFELLRRVLDDWLVIDGLWQNAYAWAALCAFELREHDKAADYLEKANKVPDGIQKSKREQTQLSALTGLVLSKQKGQSEKAKKAISIALRDADKESAWETFFLAGRFYADRPPDMLRAKANLEASLKIKPNCHSSQLWLARVQTIASSEKVRDLPAAVKTLEKLWDATGQRSWRMAYFLYEAFDRSGRADDADRMWDKALELAPRERHEQLKTDRKLYLAAKLEKNRK